VCPCLQSCREECGSLVIVRTFLYDCLVRVLGSSTTARQPRHRMSTSSGRPVDPRDPHRWTPNFLLGPGRARSRPQPVPMTLLRPASLPLPRQRSTSSGDPAAARLSVPSSVVVSSVTIVVISLFHMSDDLPERIYIETMDVSHRNGYRQLSRTL